MKAIRRILPVCLWGLLLLPFVWGALGAHPATDDFTFAAYTHPTWIETGSLLHVLKDAVSYALRTWRDWQGTVTGVILMALNPAVFDIKLYGGHAVALLLLNLAAWFVFLRHMLSVRLSLPRRVWGPLYLALSACLLLFLPDMVEGLYWFNGAWFYMGAQAVALLTLTLGDRFCACSGGKKGRRAGLALLVCGLLFALGMDNYITAMMTGAALFFMALQRLAAGERPCALRTALLLLPLGAGLALSVAAPGNAVRMAADGAHQSGLGYLTASVGRTFLAAAGYFLRFMTRTPLTAVMLLATPALCRALPEKGARRCPPVPAVLAGLYLILCAMIIPHMYASGYAGSGRVVNMYHSYVLLAVPLAWILCLMRTGPKARERLCTRAGRGTLAALALCALAFCLAGGQLSNYQKLVRDQLDGTQAAYTRQFQREYALLEAAGPEDDVALPAWTVQTVTGKPTAYEDASMWTNEAMAQYFGVRSVRVGK